MVRTVLRAEGLAVLVAALVACLKLGGPLWMLLVLALAPNLSMLAYLRGPRVGAAVYNAVHAYVGPLVLGVGGLLVDAPLAMRVAATRAGHVGADRPFGYGLKSPAGFRYTHLGTVGTPDVLEGDWARTDRAPSSRRWRLPVRAATARSRPSARGSYNRLLTYGPSW